MIEKSRKVTIDWLLISSIVVIKELNNFDKNMVNQSTSWIWYSCKKVLDRYGYSNQKFAVEMTREVTELPESFVDTTWNLDDRNHRDETQKF